MTGMHLALIPVAMTSIAEVGYDEFVLVVFYALHYLREQQH